MNGTSCASQSFLISVFDSELFLWERNVKRTRFIGCVCKSVFWGRGGSFNAVMIATIFFMMFCFLICCVSLVLCNRLDMRLQTQIQSKMDVMPDYPKECNKRSVFLTMFQTPKPLKAQCRLCLDTENFMLLSNNVLTHKHRTDFSDFFFSFCNVGASLEISVFIISGNVSACLHVMPLVLHRWFDIK